MAAFSVQAQNVFMSDPEKLSTELTGFDILGKIKNGDILIYKKFRAQDLVQVYDKEMKLKRTKDLTLKIDNYETVELIKLDDEIFQFYTMKENKMVYLSYLRYNTDLEKKGDPVKIDSTSIRLGDNFSEFKIMKSKKEAFALIYKYEYSSGRIDKLYTRVMNEAGGITMTNMVNLPDDGFSPDLIKAAITDAGRPVFLFEDDNYNCRKEKDNVHYLFVMPQGPDQYAKAEIGNANDSLGNCIKDFNFEIENTSGNIVAIGFTGDDNRDAMIGYTCFRIQSTTGAIEQENTYAFTDAMLDNIAGITDKNMKYVPVYKVSQVIPRVDGGSLLVAEFYEKTVENYENTVYDPYYGYRTSTRQVEYFNYGDIVLFSLNNDGSIDWTNIIRKKQVSKEDKGINSSYAIANCRQSIYFIFNEDIAQNNNVLQYQMLADGSLDRKSLFNPNQQEVELRNTAARQISFNEIVIPSIYRRNITFVKVVF